MNDIKLMEMNLPGDLKNLSFDECRTLCKEIRGILVRTVSRTGGHLASNLGVVELTLAIHRKIRLYGMLGTRHILIKF